MFASILFYAGLSLAGVGTLSVIVPLRFLAIRRRRVAAVVVLGGAVLATVVLLWPPPPSQSTTGSDRLDEFVPRWQFDERHAIHVDAPPEKVFAAIRAVTADEITLYRTLTWIRRFGRKGPESVLDPPAERPLLDVFTRGPFCLLNAEEPRELVVGAAGIVRGGSRNGDTTSALFHRPRTPGLALVAMNFLIVPDGSGGSNLSTETRVCVNDARALRQFAAYWRIVHPGSDIIRRMWLRAIRTRAEGR